MEFRLENQALTNNFNLHFKTISLLLSNLKSKIMAKSRDSKKTTKKEPAKTAKEKKAAKKAKKANKNF